MEPRRPTRDEVWLECDTLGEGEVRNKIADLEWSGERHKHASAWLVVKDQERADRKDASQAEQTELARHAASAAKAAADSARSQADAAREANQIAKNANMIATVALIAAAIAIAISVIDIFV